MCCQMCTSVPPMKDEGTVKCTYLTEHRKFAEDAN